MENSINNVKVSIIIPTINEEKSIGEVIDLINNGFNKSNPTQKFVLEPEILVVDTNSVDKTVEIASSKGAKVISESRRGYGRAYKTGFEHSTGEVIATLDGDLTYPGEKIPELVTLLINENLDFITCDRLTMLEEGIMSIQHTIGNKLLTATLNLLFGIKIKDSQSGMWLFRKSILDNLKLTSDGMAFSEEIKIETKLRGFKLKELPIIYRDRKGEVKLSTWKDGFKNFKFLFKKGINI